MALEARVREDYKSRSVTAFGGREFVKGQWREVPAGQEGSAGAHPFLELRARGGSAVSQEPPPVAGVAPASTESEDALPTPPAGDDVDKAPAGDDVDKAPAGDDVDKAPAGDDVDKAPPEELDATQGTPPEDARRAPEKGKATGGARRGKP